jgi:transcriptional regulator with XRE-family HTH domain
VVTTPRDALTRAFGRELRAARTKAGLTQERLAHESGVHPTYISQVERGLLSPTVTKLGAMAQALKIAPSALLRRAERHS